MKGRHRQADRIFAHLVGLSRKQVKLLGGVQRFVTMDIDALRLIIADAKRAQLRAYKSNQRKKLLKYVA